MEHAGKRPDLSDEELLRSLSQQDLSRLQRYIGQVRNPNPDRALILAAHLAIEGLLESMLETVLRRPRYWMESADYKSKVNLALSMGLIGEEERTICQIVNRARNAMVHSVEPLPEKWRIEMHRHAKGAQIHKSDPNDLKKIVMGLMVKITAPFLYARRKHYIKNVTKAHPDLWKQLLYKKMDERPDLEKFRVDIEAWRPVLEDIEQQLVSKAREDEEAQPPIGS